MIYNSEFIINTKRLEDNLMRIKQNINPHTYLIPMLKGDAYGHGLLKVAELIEDKIDFVGVAQVNEGIELRKNGFNKRIIIFAGITSDQIDAVIEYNLEPIIHSFVSFDNLKNNLNKRGLNHYPVHLKINTGLNRLGFNYDELKLLVDVLKDTQVVKIISTYSHFIEGYKPQSETTLEQFELFNRSIDMLRSFNFDPGFIHICDSGSYEWFDKAHLDAVRIGRALYMDNPLIEENKRFKDVGTWHARLIEIRNLKKGDVIGYDVNCVAKDDLKLGIINIGYGDGLISDLKDVNASVIINGQRVPLISIAMDQSYINLNNTQVSVGDVVTLMGDDELGNYMSSNEVMKLLDDEGCTQTTLLSHRVKKTYI